MSHLRRPTVTGAEAVQVTLKLQPGLPSLRTPALKACVEQAIGAGHERFGMRLLEHKLEKDGLSLVVTAPHRRALSRGIQGISVRIARAVNRKLERKGRLFADRYDAQLVGKASAGKSSAGRSSPGRSSPGKSSPGKASPAKSAAVKSLAAKSLAAKSSVKSSAAKASTARASSARPTPGKRVSKGTIASSASGRGARTKPMARAAARP